MGIDFITNSDLVCEARPAMATLATMLRHRATALLALAFAGCVHPIGGALRHAAEVRQPPPEDFELIYQEREGPLGARDIAVRGDGTVELARWRPGFVPSTEHPETILANATAPTDVTAERRSLHLRSADMERLVRTLVEIEAWEQRATDDLPSAPVEGGRVILLLRLGRESSRAWEYARDLEANDRLVRVRHVLDEVLQRAAGHDGRQPR